MVRSYPRLAALAVSVALAFAMPPAMADNTISLNFRDAEIDTVIGAYGHLLKRTFVLDPRVRGKVTLETPNPVSTAQAFELLQTVLRQQGFAVVDMGELIKVLPEPEAKLQSGPVDTGRVPVRKGDQIVTQIFTLTHESASNLVPVLRPLISPNNTIAAYPNNNSLIITDYAANLKRISQIIASLDTPAQAGDVAVIPIRYSVATDIAVAVQRLLDGGSGAMPNGMAAPQMPGAMVDPGQRVSVFADTRTNAVLLRTASSAKMQLARSLVARLDRPTPEEQANMRVVYLRNAQAIKLVEVLRAVLSGESGGGGDPQGNTFQQSARQLNTMQQQGQGGMPGQQQGGAQMQPLQGQSQGPVTVTAGGAVIAADPATNALIITAPEPVFRNIRAVIDRLDTRRAQVYIETLIVEVNADKANELGIQWQFLTAPEAGQSALVGGTNLAARNAGSNILDASANPLSIGSGLNVGIIRAGALLGSGAAGAAVNLGMLARALATEAGANIKATPNLLTLDNEEAQIVIGQNVPFVTGQYTGVAGSAVANPFQTIERKDVGTTLRVLPQVSEGGVVRMHIFQEVSSVQDSSLSSGLITNRRAIETNVLVDDGQVVVLGGLIQDRVDGSVGKVPLLGDIPIIGNLFRYDTRKQSRTNLLVFLRPVIIRDEQASWDVTASRYDYIRAVSEAVETEGRGRVGLGRPSTPDMIDMPPRPGTPGAPVEAIRGPASFWPEINMRQLGPGGQPLPPTPLGQNPDPLHDTIRRHGGDVQGRAPAAPDAPTSVAVTPQAPAPKQPERRQQLARPEPQAVPQAQPQPAPSFWAPVARPEPGQPVRQAPVAPAPTRLSAEQLPQGDLKAGVFTPKTAGAVPAEPRVPVREALRDDAPTAVPRTERTVVAPRQVFTPPNGER